MNFKDFVIQHLIEYYGFDKADIPYELAFQRVQRYYEALTVPDLVDILDQFFKEKAK